MKRVVVIGSGGAGKSTFSRRLGEATGLPVIHLDAVYWRPGWKETPKDEWTKQIEELARAEKWIMDGNFGGTREIRMRAADTIIMLDVSRHVCIYRVVKRAIKYHGRSRPDMTPGCNEKLDLDFLAWIWNYRKRSRARALAEIGKLENKRLIVLKSSEEIENFFASLPALQNGMA
jgi:adenylate kinase family enzyme